MKKLLIVLFIILLPCCLCCLIMSVISAGGPKDIQRQLSNENSAVLLIDSGEVMYKESESGEYKKAKDEQEIFKGGWVKTGESAQAHLVLDGNSFVSLDQNTEVELSELKGHEEGLTLIKQTLGNTWHRVVNISGGEYKVETPNTIASVRGTIFGTNVIKGTDSVFTIEDKIELSSSESATPIELEAGKLAQTGSGEVFQVTPILENIRNTAWFRQNKQLDEHLKEIGFDSFENRGDFLEEFNKDRSKGNVVENLQYAPTAVNDFSTLAAVGSGDSNSCDNLDQIDVQSLVQIVNYINQYFPLGITGRDIANLYADIEAACSDGEITSAEQEAWESKYSFLSD